MSLSERALRRLSELAIWAAVGASRSRDLTYEWPAVGMALAGLYVSLVLAPKGTVDLLDVFVLVGALGAAFALGRLERRSSKVLDDLAKVIRDEYTVEVKGGEFPSGC